MTFSSPIFYLFLFTTILCYHAVRHVATRQAVLLLASIIFIRSFANSWLQLLPLAGFVGTGFILVRLAYLAKSAAASAFCVITYIAAFIYLKRITNFGIGPLGFDYAVIGMSYILFRTLHLVIDAGNGELKRAPSLWMFILYTLNLFCFVSGPIQLWQDFISTDWSDSKYLTKTYVFDCFSRMITGLFKLAAVAAAANYLFENVVVQLSDPTPVRVTMLAARYAVAAMAYTAYLYFNFSGYMDIVIAAARLIGHVVPENFDRPFSSTSFLEFWQRWHMTLSNWFKSYVFTPVIVALMQIPIFERFTTITGMLCFFVTFLLMGVWHGTTEVYVVYGLLMGLGASVNKGWSVGLQMAIGRGAYRKLAGSHIYTAAARGITFSYFTLALTCLWIGTLSQLASLCRRLSAVGLCESFVVVAAAFAVLYVTTQQLFRLTSNFALARPQSFALGNSRLACEILVVVLLFGLMSHTPDFVYGAY